MPLTRARQQAAESSIEESGDGFALKQRLTRSTTQQSPFQKPSGPAVNNANSQNAGDSAAEGVKARATFRRFVSSPALLAETIAGSTPAHSIPSSDAKGVKSSPCTSTRSQISLRRTSLGPRRNRKSTDGHGQDSDSSDDEGPSQPPRFGGCQNDADPRDVRDDSNKENVAPKRRVSEAVLMAEARDAQNEEIARRTRARSSLTARRTSSSSSSSISTASTAPSLRPITRTVSSRRNNVSDPAARLNATPRPSTRSVHSPRSIPSTPTTRKRQRPDLDFDVRASPMSRLRLDTGSSSVSARSDDAESYFSSQGSTSTAVRSLFDSSSLCSGDTDLTSRATSPEAASLDLPDHLGGDKAREKLSPGLAKPAFYSNVYAHARSLLRYSAGTAVDASAASLGRAVMAQPAPCEPPVEPLETQVVGRAPERRAIQAFLSKRFGLFECDDAVKMDDVLDGDINAGSLYICGLPGTGKTALVRSVLADVLDATHDQSKTPRVAFINCMAIDNPRQIFVVVLNALGEGVKGASTSHIEAEAEKQMNKLNLDETKQTLVVLDEIDHLLKSRAHQNILYRLFAWASQGKRCSLIGIANSLDLTERFVPLLASKGAAPALMSVRPFGSAEIIEVIRTRLNCLRSRYDGEEEDQSIACNDEPITATALFAPAALELTAKKIAAATGDLRKALDAARLSIELVENEQRKQALANCTATGTGTNTEASKLLCHLTPTSAPKVTPQHIIKVLSVVLGSPNLGKLRQLGLQPKLMLAAYITAKKRRDANMPVLGSGGDTKVPRDIGEVRVADVESTYAAMLANEGSFTALESSEVLEVFELLETQGIVALHAAVEAGAHSPSTATSLASEHSASASTVPSTAPSVHMIASASVTSSSKVSPAGKRAAKKQLMATDRVIRLLYPFEDVYKGITTVASAFSASQTGPAPASADGTSADGEASALPSKSVVDAIRRMLQQEEERIRRSRGWEQAAKERDEVRREELGGGRLCAGGF